MSIDGIPQGNNPIPKIETPTPAKAAPKAPKAVSQPQVGETSQAPVPPTPGDGGVDKAAAGNGALAQPNAQSLVELQATTEKLRESNVAFQTRSAISDLGQSIVETKDELTAVAQERMVEVVQSSEEKSFFSNMGIMEKAQHINQLKEQLTEMEIERSALINDLRDKVNTNNYDPSGADILQGMLADYF